MIWAFLRFSNAPECRENGMSKKHKRRKQDNEKQAMIASLMALALLVSPIGSMGFMSQVSAEEGPGAAVSSVSGNASRTGETTEKVQLDTPANLRWGYDDGYNNVKYNMYWEGVNHSFYSDINGVMNTDWEIEVYKDDQPYKEVNMTRWGKEMPVRPDYYYNGKLDWGENGGFVFVTDYTIRTQHVSNALSYEKLNESGSYKFRVRACAAYDDESYRNSEWSEWSESIYYDRPKQELDTIVGYWDEQETGVFHFKTLQNKEYLDRYEVFLYKQCEDGTWECKVYSSLGWAGEVKDEDYSDYISQYGEGKYCCAVQAFSKDIDVVANGRPGPKSDILDTTVNAEKLSGILSGAADKSAVETVELLTDSADISAIQQAMQTSDAFREQVKDLEDRYSAERNITVESPVISDTAKEYVDPGKINVVGAAFNAAQGKAVSLQMDVTPEENRIPIYSGYKKNVQLDIKLVSDKAEIHDLAMPVSVTMPIPQGIDASQLIILHYHADGATEKTAFHVNGDGTITFTVSGFSTFVFAEESSADTPDDNPEPTLGQDTPALTPSQNANGSCGSSAFLGTLESQIASAVPGTTIRVTRDQNINILPNSIMQMLVKRGDVTLEMEYTYEREDYHVIIPAGKAVDNDILWYGPLYLSAYFSTGSTGSGNGVIAYTVQRGDTLGKIARIYHTTVARLATANPQIKNVNRITPGQIINID